MIHSDLSLTPLTAFSSGYFIVTPNDSICLLDAWNLLPGLEEGTYDIGLTRGQLPWHTVCDRVNKCCSATVDKGVAKLLRGQGSESHRKPSPSWSDHAYMRKAQPLWMVNVISVLSLSFCTVRLLRLVLSSESVAQSK